jgi:hypothetical protein
MFNWNMWADYHWDIISSMKENTISWVDINWKEYIIMEKWEFNSKLFPRIHEYKNSITSSLQK